MLVPVMEAFYNRVNSNCYEFIRLPTQNQTCSFRSKIRKESERETLPLMAVHLFQHPLCTFRAGRATARLGAKDLGSSYLKDSTGQNVNDILKVVSYINILHNNECKRIYHHHMFLCNHWLSRCPKAALIQISRGMS